MVFMVAPVTYSVGLSQSPDRALEEWFTRSPTNPTLWAEDGIRLYEEGVSMQDCEKVLVGYGLLLSANGIAPDIPVPVWGESECVREGHYIPFYEGNRLFDAGDYQRAALWYERAVDASVTPEQRAKAKSNLGMSYYWTNELDRALHWFVSATEEGLNNMTPNSIHNIASICVSLGEFKRALKFSILAEERLMTEFKEGMELSQFVQYHDLFLLSQTACHREMGDLDEAIRTFDRAHLDGFFPGMAPEFVHMAFLLSWELNDPRLLLMHAESFGEALMLDSSGAVKRLGPVLGLIPPWSESCGMDASEVWTQLRGLTSDQLPEMPSLSAEELSDVVPVSGSLWWFLTAIWCMSGLGAALNSWRRSVSSQREKRHTANGLMLLREACAPDASEQIRSQALAELRNFESRWTGAVLQVDFTALNRRELDALRAAVSGERPKESAARWGITLRAVYAVRASLRGKLGIDKDVELDAWIRQHWTT